MYLLIEVPIKSKSVGTLWNNNLFLASKCAYNESDLFNLKRETLLNDPVPIVQIVSPCPNIIQYNHTHLKKNDVKCPAKPDTFHMIWIEILVLFAQGTKKINLDSFASQINVYRNKGNVFFSAIRGERFERQTSWLLIYTVC